jgi:CubicO group peptidase (beta-lactamase class C family)
MKTSKQRIHLVIYFLILLLVSCKNSQHQQTLDRLLRSKPEAEGVDSQGIIDFLSAAEKSNHEFHSFMFLRHGKVIAEGWWSPYSPDLKHTLYSTSKSFTSTAVGFAFTENRLKLTDKVISFFPDDLPDTISQYLKEMDIKDLLTMSVGQDPDPTGMIPQNDTNWVKAFLARPIVNEPGSKFLYNSMATYMLSAIVQKVTGDKVIDYLTTRLFTPLGITGMDWETDPMGINTGGWGLRLKTEDMAKFGELYLQNGLWKEKQLIPEEWIKEATTFKIDQAPGIPDSIRNKSDWMQGYCYQFWRCRNNAFRADGAFGQYIIVMPDKDAVVAITCETPDMQGEINLVWAYLLPSIKGESLPENSEADEILKQKLGSLAVKLPEEGSTSDAKPSISGKTFIIDQNGWNLESMTFSFDGDTCLIKMKVKGTEYDIKFGKDSWAKGFTSLPGPNLLLNAKNHFNGMPPVQTAGLYRFRDDNSLELTLRYIESPHTETMTCVFDDERISVIRKFSYMPAPFKPDLTGHIAM